VRAIRNGDEQGRTQITRKHLPDDIVVDLIMPKFLKAEYVEECGHHLRQQGVDLAA
jgi:hypothetical protein